MKLKVLSENTTSSEKLGSEHGLSLYIETETHKILFDTGASGLFAENAKKLGVDLTMVDLAVISHGHYDHGGGLKTFLGINNHANIYLHQNAFELHYANRPGGVKAYVYSLYLMKASVKPAALSLASKASAFVLTVYAPTCTR